MPKRLRLVLAPMLTLLLLMQSVMPGVMAEDETQLDEASQQVVVVEDDAVEEEPTTEGEPPAPEESQPEEPAQPPPPTSVSLGELRPTTQATCEAGPSLDISGLALRHEIQGVEIQGDVVAGNTVVVKVIFSGADNGYVLDVAGSPYWQTADGGFTATTSVTFAAAPDCVPEDTGAADEDASEDGDAADEDASEDGDAADEDATEDTGAVDEDVSEDGDATDEDATEDTGAVDEDASEDSDATDEEDVTEDGDTSDDGATEEDGTPEGGNDVDEGAESDEEADLVGTPEGEGSADEEEDQADKLDLITLPDPETLVIEDEEGAEILDTDAVELIDGVEVVEIAELETTGEVTADDAVEVVEVEVIVTFDEGSTLNEDESLGWALREGGEAFTTLQLATPIIAPMSIAPGSGIVSVSVTPEQLEDVEDPIRFDFEWSVQGNPTLQEGDSFTFSMANYDLLAIPPQSDIPLTGCGSICGYVNIDADGNGVVTLNSNVNGSQSAFGDFWFASAAGWAVDLQEEEDVVVNFDVTTDDNVFELPVTIPGEPEPEPDPPGEEPQKGGWFRNGDQGRVEPDDAIRWRMRAPIGGPTAGATLTDTVPAGANWEFNCDEITINNKSGSAITADDIDCNPSQITVTIGAYHATNWDAAPEIIVGANITDDANTGDPYNQNLAFENVMTSVTWDEEGNEYTGEHGSTLTQRGTGVGTAPTKTGRFTDTTDQGRVNKDGAIEWTVRAPAGPADGVVLTETVPADAGWVFDCSTLTPIHSAGWDGTYDLDTWTEIDCTTTSLEISIGAYRSFSNTETPGFRINATVTAPDFPADQPREVHTFTNVVSSAVTPRGGGDVVNGSDDASLTQTPPAEPNTEPSKGGWFTRRDNGEFVQDGAITWQITLPAGPNRGVVMTDTAGPNWVFDCDELVIDGPQPDSINCDNGSLTITYPDGYGAGVAPVITVTATITTDFEVGQEMDNAVSVVVTDYLDDINWGENGTGTGGDNHQLTQSQYQGGTGEIGEFLVSIGDYVWLDLNRDGLQDEDEPGIPGVTVTLIGPDENGDVVTRTTTTDGNGYYWFTHLQSDAEYQLIFTQPTEFEGRPIEGWTIQDAGDDALDSDVNPDGTVTFTAPTMGANQGGPGNPDGTGIADDPTLDAGLVLVPLVSIGDYVWFDANRDGLQDPDEVPVAGVVVTLYDADDNEIGTTTTDDDGYYYFQNLQPDTDYYLIFEKPDGYAGWTTQDAGDDAADSDVDADGRVSFTSPESGDNEIGPDATDNPTLDAGLIRLVSIGDYVWFDANRDGLQDEDEVPVAGVVVTLYDAEGNEVGTTITDGDGYYYFADLEPDAEYRLVFEKPDGYAGWTTQDAGDDAADSDVNPDGEITFISPSSGNNLVGPDNTDNPTLDAGLIRLVSIGDYVWYDQNRDGLQDEDEVPVAGVVVTLYDAEGNEVGGTTTDENGYYYFADLEPGTDYYLIFEKPDGYAGWTTQDAGDDAADSDVDADGRVSFTSPESGNNLTGPDETDNPTLDAGLIRLVSIGDYVWFDANRDGLQDENEVPVAGVVVTLYDADGNEVGTTTTDENGYYYFVDLEPGTDYYLIFEKPDGYAGWTTQDAGDDAADSDVDADGRVSFTSPESGNNLAGPDATDNPTLDAGLIRLVSIGDYVWFDENKNGEQDPGEPPATGIKVRLYDADGNLVGETETDEDGYYFFKDLEPDTEYRLVFERPEGYEWTIRGSGSATDSDVDPFGEIVFRTPASGNNLVGPDNTDNPTLDAGLVVIDPDEPEPTEPVTPEPTEPVTPEPTEPITPEPTEPVTPEPTEPVTPEPTEPVTPEPTKTGTPPVVDTLPDTGSGAGIASAMMILASMAGLMLAAVALRLNAYKRS